MPIIKMKTRYLAIWVDRLGIDPETGESDPYRNTDAEQAFNTFEEAARHGCKENCYGSECFVEFQEHRFDWEFYEATARSHYEWQMVERYLCGDGEKIERVD